VERCRQSSLGCAQAGGQTYARLLGQLATGGGFQVLARIDPALRELPQMSQRRRMLLARMDVIDRATSQPNQAIDIEQHDSDVGPIEREV